MPDGAVTLYGRSCSVTHSLTHSLSTLRMSYHSGASVRKPIPLHSEQRGLPETFTVTVTNYSQSERLTHNLRLNTIVNHTKNSDDEENRDPTFGMAGQQHEL
jgi:hypothetical protein